MDKDFDVLYQRARAALNPRRLSAHAEAGGVASALMTDKGNVYVGVCIDAACSVGYCAEHAAIAAMVTAGENRIVKIVAVNWDGSVLPPCGRCREIISQMHEDNIGAEVMYAKGAVLPLSELLPHDWKASLTKDYLRRDEEA